MAKGSGSKKTALVPDRARRLTLLGPPPLIEGEDAAAYGELLNRISAAVKPEDILEEIWVRDVVDLVAVAPAKIESAGSLNPRRAQEGSRSAVRLHRGGSAGGELGTQRGGWPQGGEASAGFGRPIHGRRYGADAVSKNQRY